MGKIYIIYIKVGGGWMVLLTPRQNEEEWLLEYSQIIYSITCFDPELSSFSTGSLE